MGRKEDEEKAEKSSHKSHITLQIAILTTSTLSFFLLTILIIGPERFIAERFLPSVYFSSSCSHSAAEQEGRGSGDWSSTYSRAFYDSHELQRIAPVTGEESEDAKTWETLLIPPSGGGIRIPKSQVFDPAPEIKANGEKVGHGISMFHQLHCLIVLRGLIFPESSQDKENSTSQSTHEHLSLQYDRDHWSHCFDYIAQGIICAADDTIERTKKVVGNGKAYWHVDGVGALHQCRDARSLWEISMRTDQDPVDMSSWRNGEGARSFFADELKTPYLYDIPDVYFLGAQNS